MIITQEISAKIKELYLANVTIRDIAKQLDMNVHGIRKHCDNLRKKGELPKEKRHLPRDYVSRKKPSEVNKKITLEEVQDVWNEDGIYCTRGIANKCVFGTSATSANNCDYILITGHSRGCHWSECHRYIKGSAVRTSGGVFKNTIDIYE